MDGRIGHATPAPVRGSVRLARELRRRTRGLLLRAASGRPAKPGIRVLVYHLMSPEPVFRAHIDAIRSHADIIDESGLLEALETPVNAASARCRVLITFDDGYQQSVSEPNLALTRSLGVRPLLFVLAAAVDPRLGSASRLIRGDRATPNPLAGVEALGGAVESGWSVGSHTSTHWDCGAGTADDLEQQIGGSKAALERALGIEVRSFAYPFGRRRNISAAAEDTVRRSGYRAAFTTQRGLIADGRLASPFVLPRDVVEPWWGPQEIAGCLAGGLDRLPQRR